MSQYHLETYAGIDCVGCGSCMAVCPRAAITVETCNSIIRPTIDKSKCSKCNLCTIFCSVIRNKYLESIKPDIARIIGKPLKAYIGFANNILIRNNGASGGVTTALLEYLLNEKIVDYVVTAHQKKLIAQPVTINESKDLFEVQGSIYFPSFITKVAKEILSNQGKYAVVGLPCQIDSLRRIEATRSKLQERIHVHLGLFCRHTNEYWYLKYLSSRHKGVRCDPLAVSSRHGKWPGSINLETTCGRITIPHQEFWGTIPLLHLSSPVGCLFCDNHMNIQSDIALGTLRMRVPKITDEDDIGKTIVIAYTKRGLAIIEDAKKKSDISIKEINLRTLIESQLGTIIAKYIGVPLRRSFVRQSFLTEIWSKYTINDILISLLPLVNSHLGRTDILRRMLYNSRMFKKILGLYYILVQKMLLKATSQNIARGSLHH